MNVRLNDEEFCSENILASQNSKMVEAPIVERDRFGNVLDPLKQKLQFDPSKFVDLSKKTIMPVFNENTFIFTLPTKEFIQNKTKINFEIWLNLNIICRHTMDISRFLN